MSGTIGSEMVGQFARVLDWIKAHVAPADPFGGAGIADLGPMARDLGLSEMDLRALAPTGRDNTALMEGMMRARGLDPDVVREHFLILFRDLERVCTQCRKTARCHRELGAGTATYRCHDFCPNAGTLDDIIACENGG